MISRIYSRLDGEKALTLDGVWEAVNAGATRKALAEEYGVSRERISMLYELAGRRHLPAYVGKDRREALCARAKHIWEAVNAGTSRAVLAAKYGVSRERIRILYEEEHDRRLRTAVDEDSREA